MSFVDMVGVATDYVKEDFNLSDGVVQLISSAAFLWFFVFSVPAGLLQARFGKRNVLNGGILLSAIGLLLPFFSYSFTSILIGFSLLGIGNTIIQVSANPLLISVVRKDKASSFMSLSQFVKALGSMAAAPLTALFLVQTGNWKLVFVVFSVVSILAAFLLYTVKFDEKVESGSNITVLSCFTLLGNKFILLMVLGIFLVVGIDVGVNAVSGQFLMERFEMGKELAASGRSLYFMGKLIGCLLGAIILTKFSPKKFLNLTAGLLSLSILIFAFNPFESATWVLLLIIGFGAANIFPLIFTLTIEKYSDKANEISGLMMMAVSGGAVMPPLMGTIAGVSNYTMGMLLLFACSIVILLIGRFNNGSKK
jgi:FHS family L-fucose permease-like MFS transporter